MASTRSSTFLFPIPFPLFVLFVVFVFAVLGTVMRSKLWCWCITVAMRVWAVCTRVMTRAPARTCARIHGGLSGLSYEYIDVYASVSYIYICTNTCASLYMCAILPSIQESALNGSHNNACTRMCTQAHTCTGAWGYMCIQVHAYIYAWIYAWIYAF